MQRLIDLERECGVLRSQLGLEHRPVSVSAHGLSDDLTPTERVAYELVAHYASDMISVHTADGKYVWVSESCRQFGWQPDDLLGRSAYDLIHPDDSEHIAQNHTQHVESAQPPGVEYRYRTGSGDYHWVSTHASNAKDERGLPRIVCITRDISEQRQKLEELKELLAKRDQVEAASRAGRLLPVCAWCKSVRHGSDDWISVEAHLEQSSGRTVTHGICPSCVAAVRQSGRPPTGT